jgi:hypothetical protein
MELERKEIALVYWLNYSFSDFEMNPIDDLKSLSNPNTLLLLLNQM